MATCSLTHIFENPPLQAESPTKLIDQSLESWKNQIRPITHSSSFTEIFGELYFNEITPQSSPSPSRSSSYSSFPELINHLNPIPINKPLEKTNSLSFKRNLSSKLKKLRICNMNDDLENTDKVEDLEQKDGEQNKDEDYKDEENKYEEYKEEGEQEDGEKDSGLEGKWLWKSGRTKVMNEYPPPISCIGRSGKPCVIYQAYKNNERFILKQIPTPDFLHAHREDGRLTLHFIKYDVREQHYVDDEHYHSCVESNI